MEHGFNKMAKVPLIERIFGDFDISTGPMSYEEVASLIHRLQPQLTMNMDEKQLKEIIVKCDTTGSGQLDYDSVTNVIFNVLMKQRVNSSGKGSDISLEDDNLFRIEDFILFHSI